MAQILITREFLVKMYKKLEVFILPVLKFLLGLYVFTVILSIDHVHPALYERAESLVPTLVAWLFALLFTVMPTNLSWLLIILTTVVQVSATVELALVTFIFLLFIFLFYARMSPRESYLILFVMIAFHFNVPYLVPLLVGLYFPVTAVIPVILGVFINAQLPTFHGLMTPQATMVDLELGDLPSVLPEMFSEVYGTLLSSLAAMSDWMVIAVVFALVIVLVHVASRQAIDFSKEIAIGLGCVMMVFGFIMSILVTEGDPGIGIGTVIIMTIICGAITLLIRFFDSVLDYSRAESVQFEDDNNFYHVKIVPKVIMTRPKRTVRRIRPEGEDGEPPPERERRPRPPRPETSVTDRVRERVPPPRPRPRPAPEGTMGEGEPPRTRAVPPVRPRPRPEDNDDLSHTRAVPPPTPRPRPPRPTPPPTEE